jgi:hypothetical protein
MYQILKVLKKYCQNRKSSLFASRNLRRLAQNAWMRNAGPFYVVNTKSVEKILSKPKKQFISIAKL